MKLSLIRYILIGILVCLVLTGCNEKEISEMDPKDLPDVTAFQDEFTQEFMVSTEPVKEGYYLMQSKTGEYTMLYPEDAVLSKIRYDMTTTDTGAIERISYGAESDDKEYQYFVRMIYDHGDLGGDVDRFKNIMKGHTHYDGEYEVIEYKDKTIHYAITEYVTSDGEGIAYGYIGIIQLNNSNQAVAYNYNILTDYENNIDLDKIEKEVIEIMESVEFTE
ncbi:hypothetical protein [Oceanobacillus neutriphilus]|uniref:Lipoprotein YvcA n=1 Tax=Oceanobacillus neutriphilus TaxID=531815 RepID=A0ABQ2NYX3_9BACI|nr:hypothetical protein [Oceanobacillus neutriphilus]GGP14078.1 putative lipoprotein YvcA [Oceanobacillus neutriphilus]